MKFFFWKVRPRSDFRRFGQACGPLVFWSLVPWSVVPRSLVLWSLVPWCVVPWSLIFWSHGPLVAPSKRIIWDILLHHPSCQQKQNPSGRVIKTLYLEVERAELVIRIRLSTYNYDTGIFQCSKYRLSTYKRSPWVPCIFMNYKRSLQISSYQQK